MDYRNFEKQLTKLLSKPLPGLEIQMKMAPGFRKDFEDNLPQPRNSAVLILFYPYRNSIYVPFIEKTKYEGVHSGQISFPGGKYEETDANLEETALRESQEEIGTDSKSIKILGSLTPLHIQVSQFLVFPYIGITESLPNFVANPTEVERIIPIDIQKIQNSEIKIETVIVRNSKIETPIFSFPQTKIWGATAMILNELRTVISEIRL
jgi:8-oxo-dGTP pyrophosphatase MutT (NUDIX family)